MSAVDSMFIVKLRDYLTFVNAAEPPAALCEKISTPDCWSPLTSSLEDEEEGNQSISSPLFPIRQEEYVEAFSSFLLSNPSGARLRLVL